MAAGKDTRPARGRLTRPVPETDTAIEPRLPAAPGQDSTGTYTDNAEIPAVFDEPRNQTYSRPDRFPPSVWDKLNEDERRNAIAQMKQEGIYHGSAPQS